MAAILVPFAIGAAWSQAEARDEASPTVVRSALAQSSNVQGAPNRTLILSKVVVQPGASLPLHHHLGTQVARIQSGTLSYTVEQGSVTVRSGESESDPRTVRKIDAGQTGRLSSGQWIVEQPSDIHRAANRGDSPVVIYLATLLKTGAPPATPVEPGNG